MFHLISVDDLYQTTIKEIYSPSVVVAIKKEVNTIKNVKSLSSSLFAEIKENKTNLSL